MPFPSIFGFELLYCVCTDHTAILVAQSFSVVSYFCWTIMRILFMWSRTCLINSKLVLGNPPVQSSSMMLISARVTLIIFQFFFSRLWFGNFSLSVRLPNFQFHDFLWKIKDFLWFSRIYQDLQIRWNTTKTKGNPCFFKENREIEILEFVRIYLDQVFLQSTPNTSS